MANREYIKRFDSQIVDLFKRISKLMFRKPSLASFFAKTLINQTMASKIRKNLSQDGIDVPPVMIISITSNCNLNCAGCYSKKHHSKLKKEMPFEMLESIISQASDLGVSIIMLAGGEPFMRPEFLDITAKFPNIVFPVFTNGTLIDDEKITILKKQKHVIPALSIEGEGDHTDFRRGDGTFNTVMEKASVLKAAGTFFGVSLTATSENFDYITSKRFIDEMLENGCGLFFFVEYVPIHEDTEYLCLTDNQKEKLKPFIKNHRENYSGVFIAFPGDEEQFGGCLAAGRGFIHINPSGELEACPFAPYSDSNLNEISLKEALSSKLMMKIRDGHDKLSETKGGCALWNHKSWVESLME